MANTSLNPFRRCYLCHCLQNFTAPDVKSMMTRTTNARVARITDTKAEKGAQVLLSLFLQQHGSRYVDPVQRELNRGLERRRESRTKAKN